MSSFQNSKRIYISVFAKTAIIQNSKWRAWFNRSKFSHCKFRTKHIFMKVTFYTVENVRYECSEELSSFVPVEKVSNNNHSIVMFLFGYHL